MKMRKFKKGFTLVELVVVIAVIAVLAAVSVGAYFGVTESAKVSNSQAALKQVKDYWNLYCVDNYNQEDSDRVRGNDFASVYLPSQGFSTTNVNYKAVEFEKNENYQKANDDNLRNGILFVIETEYPTWILVEEDKLITESAVLKNEGEFTSSLTSGEYIIHGISGYDDLELRTLTDTEGNAVRGTPYIKYVIQSNESGEYVTKSPLYYPIDLSLFEASDGAYDPNATTGLYGNGDIQFSEEIAWRMYVENEGQYSPYDVLVPNENVELNAIEKIEGYDDIINGYVAKEIKLKQEFTDTSVNNIDIDTYPVIVWDKSIQKYVFYKNLDDLNGTHYDSTSGGRLPNMPDVAITSSSSLSEYNIIFTYGDKARLDSELTLKKGYLLVTEFTEFTSVQTLIDFRTKYLGRNFSLSSFNTSDQHTSTSDPLQFGSDYVEYNGFNYDASTKSYNSGYFGFFETDERALDGSSKVSQRTLVTDANNALSRVNKEVNRITIGSEGVLNVPTNSHVLLESRSVLARGGTGAGILEHGALYLESGAQVNIAYDDVGIDSSNSYFRTLGKVYGATNSFINVNKNGIVIDLFKPAAFMGGTITTCFVGNTAFPFYSYSFENIQCDVNFIDGSRYKMISGVFMSEKNQYINAFNLLSSSTYHAKEAGLIKTGSDAIMRKGYNRDTLNSKIEFVQGTSYFNRIELSMLNNKINTNDYQFIVPNIDFKVHKNSTLIIDSNAYKNNLVFDPSVTFINEGTISLKNKTNIAFLNLNSADCDRYINTPVPDPTGSFLSKTYYERHQFFIPWMTYLKVNHAGKDMLKNYGTINCDSTSYIFAYSHTPLKNISVVQTINGEETIETGIIPNFEGKTNTFDYIISAFLSKWLGAVPSGLYKSFVEKLNLATFETVVENR